LQSHPVALGNILCAAIEPLDASGGSASRNLLDAAKDALIRAAASTQPLDSFRRVYRS